MTKTIMLVEDDKDIRRLLRVLLESEGYLVESAENGFEALESLRKLTTLPSLIILDLMMPIMDGFQFRAEQEKNSRLADIPVVVMTADGRIDEKQMRIGAKAALRKPPNIDTLLELVSQFAS